MAEIEIAKLKNGGEKICEGKSLQNSNQQFSWWMNEKLCKFISNLPTFMPQFKSEISLLSSAIQFSIFWWKEKSSWHFLCERKKKNPCAVEFIKKKKNWMMSEYNKKKSEAEKFLREKFIVWSSNYAKWNHEWFANEETNGKWNCERVLMNQLH